MEGRGLLHQVGLAAAAALLAVAAPGARSGELDTAPAVLAAQSWLASVDAGRYADAWEDAADGLHVGTTREQWEKGLRRVRESAGALVSRRVVYAKYTKSSYGDPGSFAEIRFEARFEKRPAARETLSVILGFDRAWKVSSYRIR
ncbi:MAG TPA: DUF4019 domain-containing protein [Usitatibacter sp.]|nr:DUF4019 domain-containing protein [Usitatibacter sp.]